MMPYIPGQCHLPRTRSKTNWMFKNINPVWMPAHVKVSQDHSKYYIKSPSEMSRYELAELEQELRDLDDPTTGEGDDAWPEGEPVPEWVKVNPEFIEYKKQLEYLIPLRHACIKRFFLKNKYNKAFREDILAEAEDSEEFIKRFMGDEYVHFIDAIPEIKEFLEELKTKETKKLEDVEN